MTKEHHSTVAGCNFGRFPWVHINIIVSSGLYYYNSDKREKENDCIKERSGDGERERERNLERIKDKEKNYRRKEKER